jgi:hypothetical protein
MRALTQVMLAFSWPYHLGWGFFARHCARYIHMLAQRPLHPRHATSDALVQEVPNDHGLGFSHDELLVGVMRQL